MHTPFDPASLHPAALTPTPEATLSFWVDTADLPFYPRLEQQQLSADVCVIGAGIAGLTTAYLLAKAGKSVIVLEMGGIGSGQTGRTTAHLSTALDDRYSYIAQLHGQHNAQLVAHSQVSAIDLIEQIVTTEGLDCQFERLNGYLFLAPEHSESLLDRELAAAQRAGLTDTQRCPRAPLESFDTGPCLLFPRQAQFHPLAYLKGLAQAIERLGGRIFSYSRVVELENSQPCRCLTLSGGLVTAQDVVVATNTPINNLLMMHTKQMAYRSYVLGYQLPAGALEKGLYWDTAEPYHYLRLHSHPQHPEHDVLILGGADHKTGQCQDEQLQFKQLQHWAEAHFGQLPQPLWQWSGQIMEPVDGLMFAGRNPLQEHIYLITGDSGMGMTNCTAGALLVSELIQGQSHPWAALYDPSRKTLAAAGSYLKENANVAASLVGDYLGPAEVRSPAQIAPEQGAILQQQGQKLAVYRDRAGKLHACSAVCTHLGCLVHWNSAEHSWDCPCHGSRFTIEGEVLNGPAIEPLLQIRLEDQDDWHHYLPSQRASGQQS